MLINRIENSKRILETGEYQTNRPTGCEDIWLIGYMSRYLNKTKEEIKEFWYPLFCGKYGEARANSYFDIYFEKGKTITLEQDFNVYQEDIDFVNKQYQLFRWEKEFLLGLIFQSRIKNWYNFLAVPYKHPLALTEKNFREEINPKPLVDKLVQMGYIKRNVKYKFSHFDGENYENIFYSLPIPYKPKTVIRSLYSFKELSELFEMIVPDTRTCVKCGKEFIVNSKTKRNICDECHKKELSAKSKIRVMRFRNKNKCNGGM